MTNGPSSRSSNRPPDAWRFSEVPNEEVSLTGRADQLPELEPDGRAGAEGRVRRPTGANSTYIATLPEDCSSDVGSPNTYLS